MFVVMHSYGDSTLDRLLHSLGHDGCEKNFIDYGCHV